MSGTTRAVPKFFKSSILFLKYWSCCYYYHSVTQSYLTLCDPKDFSMPGFPVLHYLPEFAQNSCPLSWWCHLHISSLLPPSPALWSWTFFLRGLTLVMQSPYLILVYSYFLLLPDSYWLVSCFYKFTPFPRLSSLLESNCL